MLQEARQGCFSLLLTKEVSRFSRNILDTIAYTRQLRQLGVGVLFLSDGIDTRDVDAELRLSIMGSIAQEESRRTSARVKWGQARRMEQGVVFGRSLLGYTVQDGRLVIEPRGAAIVREIFYQYGIEKKGTSEIARALIAMGCCTSRGSTVWSNSHIIKILRNEKYVGDLVQKKSITLDYLSHEKKYNHGEEPLIILRNHHEPIVSRALWETVQAELKRRSKRKAVRGAAVQYTFSGKIWCGVCGAAFVSRERRRRDGTTYRRWMCGNAAAGGKEQCSIGWSVTDDAVYDMMHQALENIPFDRDRLAAVTAECIAAAYAQPEREILARSRRTEAAQLKEKRVQALDAFLEGRFTDEELHALTERYDKRLAALHTQSAQMENVQRDRVEGYLRSVLCGRVQSKAFCRTLIERIVVQPDGTAALWLKDLPEPWVFRVRRGTE